MMKKMMTLVPVPTVTTGAQTMIVLKTKSRRDQHQVNQMKIQVMMMATTMKVQSNQRWFRKEKNQSQKMINHPLSSCAGVLGEEEHQGA